MHNNYAITDDPFGSLFQPYNPIPGHEDTEPEVNALSDDDDRSDTIGSSFSFTPSPTLSLLQSVPCQDLPGLTTEGSVRSVTSHPRKETGLRINTNHTLLHPCYGNPAPSVPNADRDYMMPVPTTGKLPILSAPSFGEDGSLPVKGIFPYNWEFPAPAVPNTGGSSFTGQHHHDIAMSFVQDHTDAEAAESLQRLAGSTVLKSTQQHGSGMASHAYSDHPSAISAQARAAPLPKNPGIATTKMPREVGQTSRKRALSPGNTASGRLSNPFFFRSPVSNKRQRLSVTSILSNTPRRPAPALSTPDPVAVSIFYTDPYRWTNFDVCFALTDPASIDLQPLFSLPTLPSRFQLYQILCDHQIDGPKLILCTVPFSMNLMGIKLYEHQHALTEFITRLRFRSAGYQAWGHLAMIQQEENSSTSGGGAAAAAPPPMGGFEAQMPTVLNDLRHNPLEEGEERLFNFPNGCVKAENGTDGKVRFSYDCGGD
jgi:hypothetical protein